MAKNSKNRGKVEKELDTVDISINGILNQYKVLDKKERKEVLKGLLKEEKQLVKAWVKTQQPEINYKIARVQSKIKSIENQSEKIHINYGICDFHIKADYLKKIKNKEQYLDGLFHRKMKRILNDLPPPQTEGEAKQLEGLITQYSKKIRSTKFYDPNIVENSLNKIANFENKISGYNPSDFIKHKRDVIEDEINGDFEEGREIMEEIYKAIEKPLLIDGNLVGIQFNFF